MLYKHCFYQGLFLPKEFSHLGDVRSLIPASVKVMALTATATRSSWGDICKVLGMAIPTIVAMSPNKPNVKYVVKANPGRLEETFAGLVEETRQKRISMDRTIIFCRTYD